MARRTLREPVIESELILAFAKTERLTELEDFISSPNIAQVMFDNLFLFDFWVLLDSKYRRPMFQ